MDIYGGTQMQGCFVTSVVHARRRVGRGTSFQSLVWAASVGTEKNGGWLAGAWGCDVVPMFLARSWNVWSTPTTG